MTYNPRFNSSVMSSRNEQKVDFSRKVFGNHSLRLGMVLERIDTEDESNISKLGPEYNVMAIEQDMDNGSSSTIYKNCISTDGFGGVADYFQHTLRPAKDPKKVKNQASLKEETGSIVLLLCLDSHSEKAIILKSLHNPSNKNIINKEKGHHLEGEFNGVSWSIDKNGALNVTFKTPTMDDGMPTDEVVGGSSFSFEQDGSFEVNNKPLKEGEGKGTTVDFESIRLDKTTKKVSISARDNVDLKTDKSFNVTAEESFDAKLKKDMIIAAQGKATINADQTFDIEAKGAMSIKSKSFDVESKATINFKAQSAFEVDAGASAAIKAPQVMLGPSAAEPALLAFSMLTLGTGFAGVPVISNAIAGFSTSITLSP